MCGGGCTSLHHVLRCKHPCYVHNNSQPNAQNFMIFVYCYVDDSQISAELCLTERSNNSDAHGLENVKLQLSPKIEQF